MLAQESIEREARGEKRQYCIARIVRLLMRIFWIFPVQENKVFCIASNGKRYYDSPKYICEKLLELYPGKFKIVWAVSDSTAISEKRIKFIKVFSLRHFYHYCTAKIIITNSGMPTYMPKRKAQYSFNTWHGGGAYKRAFCRSEYRVKMNEYKGKCLDVFVSSCKRFSELEIPDLAQGYAGEIMPCGLPRNDILFIEDKTELRAKVCKTLDIDQSDLIVLYAPTYRGWFDNFTDATSNVSHDWDINIKQLCDALGKRFQKKVAFVFRKHGLDSAGKFEGGVDATSYPDTQELLCAVDVLISDYSSIIWDYSITKRPCFLYAPDKDYYLNEDRGVYTPMDEWPGIICQTNEELQRAVLEFDEDAYRRKVEEHHKNMGSYESGTACEQVCKRIIDVCGVSES